MWVKKKFEGEELKSLLCHHLAAIRVYKYCALNNADHNGICYISVCFFVKLLSTP